MTEVYDEMAQWLGWETGKLKTIALATAPQQPWAPSDTAAELDAKEQVKREVSDIAQRPHIAKPKPAAAGWRGAPPKRLEVVSPPPPVEKDSEDVPQRPPKPAPAPAEKDERWWRGRQPTVKWDYFDADGALWATVLRWDDPVRGKHVQPSKALPEGRGRSTTWPTSCDRPTLSSWLRARSALSSFTWPASSPPRP